MDIKIGDLERKINSITRVEKKQDFITKYDKYNKIFNEIDLIMEESNDINKNTSIQELFTQLNDLNNNIGDFDNDNIDVKTLKKLKNIIEMIEYKLNTEKINIIKEN